MTASEEPQQPNPLRLFLLPKLAATSFSTRADPTRRGRWRRAEQFRRFQGLIERNTLEPMIGENHEEISLRFGVNGHLDDDKLRNRSIRRPAIHQPPARPAAA